MTSCMGSIGFAARPLKDGRFRSDPIKALQLERAEAKNLDQDVNLKQGLHFRNKQSKHFLGSAAPDVAFL